MLFRIVEFVYICPLWDFICISGNNISAFTCIHIGLCNGRVGFQTPVSWTNIIVIIIFQSLCVIFLIVVFESVVFAFVEDYGLSLKLAGT